MKSHAHQVFLNNDRAFITTDRALHTLNSTKRGIGSIEQDRAHSVRPGTTVLGVLGRSNQISKGLCSYSWRTGVQMDSHSITHWLTHSHSLAQTL